MKTLYRNDKFQLVDNEQEYDFVGYIENHTQKTLVVIFMPGDIEFDEESDTISWDEDGWSVDEVAVCDANELERKREYVEENASWPNFTMMIEIEPKKWAGFPADNRGRSMFNALRTFCEM